MDGQSNTQASRFQDHFKLIPLVTLSTLSWSGLGDFNTLNLAYILPPVSRGNPQPHQDLHSYNIAFSSSLFLVPFPSTSGLDLLIGHINCSVTSTFNHPLYFSFPSISLLTHISAFCWHQCSQFPSIPVFLLYLLSSSQFWISPIIYLAL